MIEQSLKFNAKKNGHWPDIMQIYHSIEGNRGDPQLSFIIKEYNVHLSAWIPDQNIAGYLILLLTGMFQADKFNLVIHSPECYTLSPDTLKSIPNEGLLALTNYLLS